MGTTSPTHQGAQDLNQSPSLEHLPPRTGIYDLSKTSEIEKLEKNRGSTIFTTGDDMGM